MADNPLSSDDFDKLLDDFIAAQLQDTEDQLAELDDSDTSSNTTSTEDAPSLVSLIDQASDENRQFSQLAAEEKKLYTSFCNFINAVRRCAEERQISFPDISFDISELLPRFRPSRTQNLGQDILNGWEVLISAQASALSSLPANPTDEQILNFAEKTTDKNLQEALLSYVETLIELDSCEIAYNMRKIKYERHKIEKKLFEEQQKRHEKMHRYIDAIRAKRFPVDAERLVTNFFKTVRKDPDGAAKMLENNPATFAPIQVDKIPARFFGLIKPKPEDGIKVNKKLGKFLKHLKA